MSVARRGKGVVDVGGRRYHWHVAPDTKDPTTPVMHVAAVDQSLQIRLPLLALLVGIQHVEVAGVPAGTRRWRRFRTPLAAEQSTTPDRVRSLVEWCLGDAPKVEVDWRGVPVASE